MRRAKEGDGIVSYIVLSIFSSLHFHYGLLYASIALGAKTTSMACDGYFIAYVRYLSIMAELLNSSNVLCFQCGSFLTFSFLMTLLARAEPAHGVCRAVCVVKEPSAEPCFPCDASPLSLAMRYMALRSASYSASQQKARHINSEGRECA